MNIGLLMIALLFLCLAYFCGLFIYKPKLIFEVRKTIQGMDESRLVSDWGRFRACTRFAFGLALLASLVMFFLFLDQALHRKERQANAEKRGRERRRQMLELERKQREQMEKQIPSLAP